MPSRSAELPPSFSRSAEEGKVADTRTRSFRVILSTPGETFDPQSFLGVSVGTPHPWDAEAYCTGFRAEFEGESRMSTLVHFDYTRAAGRQDNKNQEPSVRPANWSTDVSTVEMPTTRWIEYGGVDSWKEATNPAGDIYDGVSHLVPSVTITVEQYEPTDPTRHAEYAGHINSNTVKIGSLDCTPHTLMLRGISSKPHVEAFGNTFWRGWICQYQFLYRTNKQTYHETGAVDVTATKTADVGWDVVMPVTGFNIRNQNLKDAKVEDGSLNLTLDKLGKITGWDDGTYTLAAGTNGNKMRGMILISSPGGGATQRPSAQPLPLNMDATPRKSTLDPRVILKRYQVQPSTSFTRFNLRLL